MREGWWGHKAREGFGGHVDSGTLVIDGGTKVISDGGTQVISDGGSALFVETWGGTI